jgi:hypothetical protein
MMKYRILLTTLWLVITGCVTTTIIGASGLAYSDINMQDYEFTLPAGTMIPALLMEPVTTENAVVGQPVNAIVAQDIYIGTKRILSRQDHIYGRVSDIQPPYRGKNAILQVDFHVLSLSSGVRMPIATMVDTESNMPYWGGGLTPGTKPVIVPYHVYQIGSYGRVMYQGPRAMGEHIKLLPGERINLVLLQPLTLYIY